MEKALENFRDELLPIANPAVQVCVYLAVCVYSVHIGVRACLQTLETIAHRHAVPLPMPRARLSRGLHAHLQTDRSS